MIGTSFEFLGVVNECVDASAMPTEDLIYSDINSESDCTFQVDAITLAGLTRPVPGLRHRDAVTDCLSSVDHNHRTRGRTIIRGR